MALKDHPELYERFRELQQEKKTLQIAAAPIREERDALSMKIAALEAERAALDSKIAAIERPRLADIDGELAAIARDTGGRVMSQPQ